MAESIQTIIDKAQFKNLFDTHFSNDEIFIKTKSGDLKIQYLGYSEDTVAFRVPRVKNVPEIIIAFTRHEEHTIYVSLKVVENSEDTFIFIPTKFQIIAQERKENRTTIGDGVGKSILYISNIISDSIIQNSLTLNEKKIDHIRDRLLSDLKKRFEKIRLVLIHETTIDPRMKHLVETRRPLFISDMNKNPDEKSAKEFNYYINEIYAKDYKLSSQKDFISEITVPIIFRTIIPYGYIQVNGTKPFQDAHFSVIRRMAVIINDLFTKEKMFLPAKEKFLVSDVSKNGIGIVFKDRRQTRFFRQGSTVSLDMVLPNQEKVILGIVVRNTSFLDNGIIKVGAQIVHMDAISEVNYDEFLATTKGGGEED